MKQKAPPPLLEGPNDGLMLDDSQVTTLLIYDKFLCQFLLLQFVIPEFLHFCIIGLSNL